jgi:hypothetical protein
MNSTISYIILDSVVQDFVFENGILDFVSVNFYLHLIQ